ncbi:MAG: type II 3-dehydroquinate dehydratase [Bacteroidales bacterium]|nr:type II 3-dehydroquinate dehydratase [Bacteroidales bacterium]MCF8333955.1 type II 3-dehydroquinate dehydratase [Bacteroidales bacterium]
MKIVIINGPNLNLTGIREKDHYGEISFEEYVEELRKKFPEPKIEYFQSNVEGEIINKLHEEGFNADGIILNAGGYTHTSVAIGDAVKAIQAPVIEVHMSNVHSRETFRQNSYIAPSAAGTITGMKLKGYELAIWYFITE